MANVVIGNAARNRAEAPHLGVVAAICKVSISATTSAGDVLYIGKLPHRAQIVDAVWYPGAAFVNNTIVKYGLSGTEAAILASDSYSTAFGAANGAGCHLNVSPILLNTSRSDDNAQRFTYITCTPTDILTAGHHSTLVVFYKMPGQAT